MMSHVPKLAGTECYFSNYFRYFSYFTLLIQQINQPLAYEIHQLNWVQINIKHIGSSYSMTFVSLRGVSNPPYTARHNEMFSGGPYGNRCKHLGGNAATVHVVSEKLSAVTMP